MDCSMGSSKVCWTVSTMGSVVGCSMGDKGRGCVSPACFGFVNDMENDGCGLTGEGTLWGLGVVVGLSTSLDLGSGIACLALDFNAEGAVGDLVKNSGDCVVRVEAGGFGGRFVKGFGDKSS